jgi:hypothetical protein
MEDRLSTLPDDLLHQILVLLPLIQAVRTCVLSRRWRRFWTQAQILNIVDNQVDGGGQHGRFVRVVDSILSAYASRLSRARCFFQISISREDNVDVHRLTSWARRAAELFEGDFVLTVETEPEDSDEEDSEEELEMEIFELPYFEFAKRITVRLSDRFLCLALPTGAGAFASLTNLMLMSVCFADGAGAGLGEVVSSRCPCLVILDMRYIQGVTALTLRTESLTHLTLSQVQGLRLLDVVAPKLHVMAVHCCFVESKGAVLRVSTPSLLRVEWLDCCPEHTEVAPTDNLKTMLVGEIPSFTWDENFKAHSNFDKILSHFRRTEALELHLPIRPVSISKFRSHARYIYFFFILFF